MGKRRQDSRVRLPTNDELAEHRMRVVNQLNPEARGVFTCSKCKQKLPSLVSVKHHQESDCPGKPGGYKAKTTRFKEAET